MYTYYTILYYATTHLMINVLHWINLPRMYRCHLTFEDTDQFTHYYLTDKVRRGLKHKKNVIAGGVRDPSFLQRMLNKIRPQVIICSNLIENTLMKIMKDNCQHLIYIHHTIWTDGIMDIKIREKRENFKKYNIFDKMYFTENEIKMWKKIGIDDNKLRRVCGLTYMDPLFMSDHKKNRIEIMAKFFKIDAQLAMDAKTILFIHNNTLTGCLYPNGLPKDPRQNSEEYGLMLNGIREYAEKNNCYVFAKIGRRSSTLIETKLIRQVHQSDRIAVIRPENDWLLSDFLFCDAIINQSYSAAYQESLIVSGRAACCYLNATEIIDSSKYPHLPVIRSLQGIPEILDRFLNHRELFDTPEIKGEINLLMIDTFGDRVENVTDAIMCDLKDKFIIEPVS